MADPTSTAKNKLSGSTDGKQIKVAASGTPGTLIHTCRAVTGVNNWDEIWIWANNSSTSGVKLTIEWGGVTSPDDTLEITIPPESGDVLIIAGKILQNGLLVRAFAASGNVINISGFVNEISA
jgi:hypothetical protein